MRTSYHGEIHHDWLGDDASVQAIHNWVRRRKKKTGVCAHCGQTGPSKTEWANVSGNYERDLDDYIELCTPCHRIFDRDGKHVGSLKHWRD